jgi:hypothetical protein
MMFYTFYTPRKYTPCNYKQNTMQLHIKHHAITHKTPCNYTQARGPGGGGGGGGGAGGVGGGGGGGRGVVDSFVEGGGEGDDCGRGEEAWGWAGRRP